MYRILPTQRSLTLHNTSQLFINLEGCVNSLRGECMDFLHYYGRDGENNTAQSRYPCFYNKVMMIIYYYMSWCDSGGGDGGGSGWLTSQLNIIRFQFNVRHDSNARTSTSTYKIHPWQNSHVCSFSTIQIDSAKVLARFDLDKTWREFVFFFGIPSVLFVVSFITLLIITRSVSRLLLLETFFFLLIISNDFFLNQS